MQTNGPIKKPLKDTLNSFLHSIMSAVLTHLWDFFFFTFSSLFLHVLVAGLLSGVARMELCDAAWTPDILQWTVNLSLRTFHSHLQLHESGARMGTKRMVNIQTERHQQRRMKREAGRQVDRRKDRQLDRGCLWLENGESRAGMRKGGVSGSHGTD